MTVWSLVAGNVTRWWRRHVVGDAPVDEELRYWQDHTRAGGWCLCSHGYLLHDPRGGCAVCACRGYRPK